MDTAGWTQRDGLGYSRMGRDGHNGMERDGERWTQQDGKGWMQRDGHRDKLGYSGMGTVEWSGTNIGMERETAG